jgi:hypothetical protein
MEDAVARRDAWRRVNVPQADSSFETSSSSGSHRPLAGIHGDPKASGGMKNSSSSPSIFRPHDFPNLKDARQSLNKKKKFGPPFDSADWNFKYTTKRKEFPFDEATDEALKIKFAPIWLCWPLHDSVFSIGGHFWKEKWFRSPPKVCIVPGS